MITEPTTATATMQDVHAAIDRACTLTTTTTRHASYVDRATMHLGWARLYAQQGRTALAYESAAAALGYLT